MVRSRQNGLNELKQNESIIDDPSAADSFLVTIYQMAATPGVKVDVFSTKQAGEEWQKDQFGTAGPIVVLFRSVEQAFLAYEAGFTLYGITAWRHRRWPRSRERSGSDCSGQE